MGAQCSAEGADLSREECSLNSPLNAKKPVGSLGGFCGGKRHESSETIDDALYKCTSPHAAELALRRVTDANSEADRRKTLEETEQDGVRWAPPVDDQPDRIDEKDWAGMMSAIDHFLPFEDNSTVTPSSSSQNMSDGSGKESFVTAAAREAALEKVREGLPLLSIPKELRSDKDVVLAAIEQEGPYCYDYIDSKELKERDRDVVMALVRADGSLLENACEELRGDKQVVRCALSTCSEALKVAPARLQCDKELKAVAASRAKQEQKLMQLMVEEMCGPNVASACMPK